MSTFFDDLPNDLDSEEAGLRFKMTRTVDGGTALRRVYRDTCSKCGGDGRWKGHGDCTGDLRCTMCDGRGYKEFRTSPEERAKARDAAARAKQREAEALEAKVQAWHRDNAVVSEWLVGAAARNFEFAQSLLESLEKYGSLTERQMETATRLAHQSLERRAQWQAEKTLREAAAPTVDAARLEQSFRTAKTNGLKWPRITMGDMVVKLAGDNSKNPGALYVTEHGQYLGKVMGGRFFKVRECGDTQEQQVVALINDPVGAAEAYGHLTGHCCICSRELTNPESVARGIGPICADKFGW
jgi:hypothetical protein